MTKTGSSQKKPTYSPWSDPFFESMKGIGGGIAKGVKNDFGKGVAKGVGRSFGSFFGTGFSGENLDRQERPPYWAERKERIPQQTYYERQRYEEKVLFTHVEFKRHQEIERQIQAIRAELEAIIEEMKMLGKEVTEAKKTLASTEVNPGKYHVGIFDRIRQFLKLLRKQISESRSWLEVTYTKKKARRYWWMYKKHGTTFGLSYERVIATQAG